EAPVLYQEGADGLRTTVAGRYLLLEGGDVGFEVQGAYDTSRVLVIDPAISFASYLGGSGDDIAYGVAADAAGNSYVTGETASSNFPTQDGYDTSLGSNSDAFVSKVAAKGNQLIYSTYLGSSSGPDKGYGISVDPSGSAYLTGSAYSGFPITSGAYQTTTL